MDFLVELFLSVLDGVLDVVIRGGWSRWQGEKVPNIKVKKV